MIFNSRRNRRRRGALSWVDTPASSPKPKRRVGRPSRIRRSLGFVGGWSLPLVVGVLAFATPMLGVRGYHYIMESEHFHVRDVLVEGNERLDYATLAELAGIAPGMHLLQTDLDQMTRAIERHAWVARATVTRELPDRIIIRITEHRPAALIAFGSLYVINGHGDVLTAADGDLGLTLPIITGLDPQFMEDTEVRRLARPGIQAALNLGRQYESMGLAARWPVGEVRVEPGRRLTLVLSGTGTEARLGRPPYRDKLYRLEWVLENLRTRDEVADYVLLDAQPGGDFSRDDGRVIVRAAIAQSDEAMAQRAAERALTAVNTQANEAAGLGETPRQDIDGRPEVPDDKQGEALGSRPLKGPGAVEVDAQGQRKNARSVQHGQAVPGNGE